MQEKWLFFDVDGTIAPVDGGVTAYNRQALQKARAAGHHLLINSGRSLGYIYNKIRDAGFDGVIAGMGTTVMLHGKTLLKTEFDPAVLQRLVRRWITEKEVRVTLEGDRCNYTIFSRRHDSIPNLRVGHPTITDWRDAAWMLRHDCFGKLTVFEYAKDIPADMLQEVQAHCTVVDQGYYQEITPKGCGKGVAIEWLCRHMGVNIRDTVAFGDSWNDLDMLDAAGYSVVTAGAPDGVKMHADAVTGSYEDGVGRWIEEHLL